MHRVFNIGSGKPSALIDFVNSAKKIYPDFNADIGPGLAHAGTGFNFYSVYNISRAKNELNYIPKYDIESGVAKYIETMEKLNIPANNN